ncbi:YHYH domain-containing protein [Mitsuaria sp. GD03876]|uniref:YHYH domain-containing protein n=1 Tax=Mitsuaria sp. GD03876 TaxID=2975399 RepID=UPI0024469CD9|nr:YHYH domain-containing protein [Mitsuaria sp. GD03876]MDH0864726.1 YHYH domain-containing protein [Mitsuaria sp. GD03876]
MNKRLTLWLSLVVLATPMAAIAHGGGLDADGCHTNRKTGDYHCHRAPTRSAPAPATAPTPARQALTSPAPAAASAPRASAPDTARPSMPTCYTGPRGGTYTLTKSGKKNYGGC